MHNITVSERRGRGFGEEHKGVFGRAWREKWKGKNNCIIIAKATLKAKKKNNS